MMKSLTMSVSLDLRAEPKPGPGAQLLFVLAVLTAGRP